MINSPPVQRYSKFWSSSPNYLLLFMFQSPHPLCLVFIVSALSTTRWSMFFLYDPELKNVPHIL